MAKAGDPDVAALAEADVGRVGTKDHFAHHRPGHRIKYTWGRKSAVQPSPISKRHAEPQEKRAKRGKGYCRAPSGPWTKRKLKLYTGGCESCARKRVRYESTHRARLASRSIYGHRHRP